MDIRLTNVYFCSVDFYTHHTYDQITKLLQAEYSFKPNGNGSAATTEAETKKVVLALYRTKKLLIEGAGTWTWRNRVFRSMSSKLTICGSDNSFNTSTSTAVEESGSKCRQADNTTGIASPANLLNKMLNKFKSPRSASTPLSSSPKHTQFTGAKKARMATTDAVKSTSSTNSDQADGSIVETESEDEITCVKQLYSSNNEASQNQQKSSQETSSLISIKAELEKYKNANKELQETSRKLLKETKTLKQDHEKVLKALETKTNEINSSKKKLETSAKTLQEKERTIKDLREKLASASADSQELNNKLKSDIKNFAN